MSGPATNRSVGRASGRDHPLLALELESAGFAPADSEGLLSLAAQSQVWSVTTSGPARFLAVGVNGDVYAASLSALHAVR